MSTDFAETTPTHRRYKDGQANYRDWSERLLEADESYKCPTYVHRAPPCQAACPSGHDVRGWLNIVRGLEKPPAGMSWQEYAFRRMTKANPFPAIMGRVCPAPCEDGCNRNELEDHVGINSIEQFIGDWALANHMAFDKPTKETGKKVAVVGGGPGGLAAAYQLRKLGHGVTIFEEHELLGGMMRYGIPGYRVPREVLDGEIKRILDLGVEVRAKTKVGKDVAVDQLRKDFDAIFVALGAQSGQPLDVPGADAPNFISGLAFLDAFNQGRLRHLTGRVLVIGGGDTAMDVAAVARRLGNIQAKHEKDRPEHAIFGQTTHDVAAIARREGAEVMIVYRRPIEKAPATKHELDACIREGVIIQDKLAPIEAIKGPDGRAKALKVVRTDWSTGKQVIVEGSEFEIECDLIVAAVGQSGDLSGFEEYNNGKGLMAVDKVFRAKNAKDIFVAGDVINPNLLTTAIGQAWRAVQGIDRHIGGGEPANRPKVDVHHFNLLGKLDEAKLAPENFPGGPVWGSCDAGFGVHNYEDRSFAEVITHDNLYLAHFPHVPRNKRQERVINAATVLDNFEERIQGLSEAEAVAEAKRCMSCGLCFECDSCVIYCPQTAVKRVAKTKRTMGRYVETDYDKCIGCHICADVCPTGYIHMGLEK